jgi:peptide/nickel transport system substrate-binding protein
MVPRTQHSDRTGLTRRELLERGALAGVAASLPAVLAGFPATAAAATPRSGGTFRVAISDGGPTESLDPQAIVSATDQYRSLNLFDRLTEVQADTSVAMHLAESVEPTSKDATRWRAVLRKGVVFSNGKPVTADDVLYSFRRIGLNKKAPYFSNVDPFVDVRASRKVDSRTVEFVLKQPYGDFTRYLANRYLMILPSGADRFKRASDVVGTGAFRLKSFTPGQRSELVKNPHYFLAPGPYFDKVLIIQVAKDAQINALQSGQIDGTETFDQIAQGLALKGNPRVELFTVPAGNAPQFNMRLDRAPFTDVRVRQAFKLAVDRERMLQLAFQKHGKLGNDLHGRTFTSYASNLPQRTYDPERAKSLLKAAGRENLTVQLVTGLYPDAAAAYVEQAKPAGITIKLKRIPGDQVYNTQLYYLKVPFGETGWGTDSFEFIAPQAYLQTAPYNETAWKRPAWDKKFLKATGIVDPAKRNVIFKQLEAELWRDGGELIWNWGDSLYGGNSKLRGVVPQVPGFIWNDLRFRMLWFAS